MSKSKQQNVALHYQETEGGNQVDEKLLEDIIGKIKHKSLWAFGRHLGLDQTDLDEIKFANKEEGLCEIRHAIQKTFLEKFGSKATLERIIYALKKIRKNDLVENILSSGKTSSIKKTGLNEARYEECLDTIREYMIRKYWDVELPKEAFWGDTPLILNENYIELTMNLKYKFGRNDYNRTIPIEYIFEKFKGKIPKRILIESDPGFGKTTLSLKLASDWAREKKYIGSRFDLLFYVNLKNFTVDLNEILLNQMTDIENITDEEKLDTVKMARDRVLLILDDFHELDNSSKLKFRLLLNGLAGKCMTVIITSLTDEMNIEDDYLQRTKNMDSSSMEIFWDKRIQIQGISKEVFDTLPITKYILNEENNECLTLYRVQELWYYSPLVLFLFTLLRKTNPQSMTEFFTRFIQCMVKRTLVKKRLIDGKTEIDIFKNDGINGSYHRLFFQFGNLAFNKLFKNELWFTREEILLYCSDDKNLFLLGFFRKRITFSNYRLTVMYEVLNRSFLEYFASFYISIALRDEAERVSVTALLRKCTLLDDLNSLLQSFIIGLAKEDVHLILRHVVNSPPFMNRFAIPMFSNIFREMNATFKNVWTLIGFPLLRLMIYALILSIMLRDWFKLQMIWFYIVLVVVDLLIRDGITFILCYNYENQVFTRTFLHLFYEPQKFRSKWFWLAI